MSLLTDRLANSDDDNSDGTHDRRGWWADMPLPLASAPPTSDLIGSRLWLLSRRQGGGTDPPRDAIAYTQEALQWLLDDGVAARIDVGASFRRDITGWLDIAITAPSRRRAGRQSKASRSPGLPRLAFLWPGPDPHAIRSP